MRLALLSLFATLPALAQFRSIEITFQGIGCASCIESLPARVQRMRGVESASVDAARGILKIELAAENRMRLEQVRDAIEQDGTKTVKATVRVKGEVAQVDGKWMLRPAGLSASYEIEGKAPAAGSHVVVGEVTKLRPDSGGTIVIRATRLE
jgi:cation transport ATPase